MAEENQSAVRSFAQDRAKNAGRLTKITLMRPRSGCVSNANETIGSLAAAAPNSQPSPR
jgi:multidrug resistance efflux pump